MSGFFEWDSIAGIILNFFIGLIIGGITLLFWCSISFPSKNAIENSKDWGGYCPYEIYTVFNKHTGVYYGVTATGDICPLYTIEGEVMLVDQGNEYVVHKNLGGPDAQE